MSVYFLYKSIESEGLDFDKQESIKDYIRYNLYDKISFLKEGDDYDNFFELLKKLDFDLEKVTELIDTTYELKNVASDRKGYRSKIGVKLLTTAYRVFNDIDYNYLQYDKNDEFNNHILNRVIFKISQYDENLNLPLTIQDKLISLLQSSIDEKTKG